MDLNLFLVYGSENHNNFNFHHLKSFVFLDLQNNCFIINLLNNGYC